MNTYSLRRRWVTAGAVLVLGAGFLAVTLPADAATASAEIAPAVRAQLERDGRAPFWIMLEGKPDLSAVEGSPAGVYDRLTREAATAQQDLRALLTARKATFEPFWISNAIRVVGDTGLLAEVASRPEVARIDAEPAPAEPRSAPAVLAEEEVPQPVNGVEWNIHRIGADTAWAESGSRGEGIVVANIDTGVKGDHPALAGAYRGRYGNGAVDNAYNWFDPTGSCAGPCDDDGHGTHVMGLEAGRAADGGNQIGVAPGARWIAARRCCEVADALRAGQWMLAPTDADGANPRPDLAPDVVNISWYFRGDNGSLFGDILDAWVAAGIFPVIAAGNNGNGGTCATNTWPASFDSAYTVGNTTPADVVSGDSSRGPTQDGRTKPDISAPGTAIRSSHISAEFAVQNGTSQAAPQVAGAVALLWSAVPELDGDVAATRRLLDDTARDIDDTTCGGTADDNSVAGEGLLDIAAALRAAPRGPVGALTGTTVGYATVQLNGPRLKNLTADADGRFALARMVPGTYTYRVSAFGHQDATGTVTVPAGGTATLPVTPVALPSATVTGVVRSAEGPVAGATVTVAGTPARVATDADGRYRLTLPTGGDYLLSAESPSRCALPADVPIEVTADRTLDVDLPARTDLAEYGHTCTAPVTGYQAGTTRLDLSGNDGAVTQVDLPFPVSVYGSTSRTAWISGNGALSVTGPIPPPFIDVLPEPPDSMLPTGAVLPFYSVLGIDAQAGVYTTLGADQIVVEWRDVQVLRPFSREPDGRISVSLVLRPDGTFTVNYRTSDPGWYVRGRNALIGLQNADGTDAFIYSALEVVVRDGLGFTIRPPRG
ncbi:S8 family serine peptidase [Catenuloplanes sp. NPDC051500]|uniref:S8 family serine peptidase n=1 Tax=Catenuloplanes sp. NPDC051500 TaxID=3363959 RepID=UPI0037BD59F0